MKTRKVDKFRVADYMQRAEECLELVEYAYENKKWGACVVNAVQCAISAADAYCVFKKGERNESENHSEAIRLFLSINPNDADIKRSAEHLSSLISIKSDAQYGERRSTERDAGQAKLHAERLFEFVESKVKKP